MGISNEQYKEAELIYEKLQCIYNHGDFRLLRFFIAFNLPKRLLPNNLDIVAKKNIRKCRIELIEELYRKYQIEFTFSKYDLCNILLGRNKQSSVLAFSKALFEINELDKQLYLLRNAILKRKYFSAFCLSLLKDKTKREYYANKFDNPKDILIKVNFFARKNYPLFNQVLIEEVINSELMALKA